MGDFLSGPLATLHSGPAPQAPPRQSRLWRNLFSAFVLAAALGWAARDD